MLRIKKDVDLKELEKYGFEDFSFFCFYKNKTFKLLRSKHLCIDKENKEIYLEKLEIWQDSRESLNLLYDLIKDGLVEKVEG